MNREELDRWAADHIGESPEEAAVAVETEAYTGNPGAAFLVLAKCADEGCSVSVQIEDGKVKVACDEGEAEGSVDDLAMLIVKACYECMDEEGDDDGDDA